MASQLVLLCVVFAVANAGQLPTHENYASDHSASAYPVGRVNAQLIYTSNPVATYARNIVTPVRYSSASADFAHNSPIAAPVGTYAHAVPVAEAPYAHVTPVYTNTQSAPAVPVGAYAHSAPVIVYIQAIPAPSYINAGPFSKYDNSQPIATPDTTYSHAAQLSPYAHPSPVDANPTYSHAVQEDSYAHSSPVASAATDSHAAQEYAYAQSSPDAAYASDPIEVKPASYSTVTRFVSPAPSGYSVVKPEAPSNSNEDYASSSVGIKRSW